ncbi:hypothetical protein I5Q06_24100 [Serratia ureilytica]|uniref:hypothetical protein n=1 Tax=Serratia ureilytica TaxID=300181 RepID=UPI0018D612A1|nr:hypothetical protein [Serratia ureilytica]MBH3322447.1 hypothetical protein [Serratia ureilytica]
MSHPLNHTWSALCVCSASLFRMLFLWPGVVLAMFGLLFLLATFADDGGQRAADMAVTAQNYRAAPAGSVMFRPCPYPQGSELLPELKAFAGPSAVPGNKTNCQPYPLTFAAAAAQERRVILGAGSALFSFGVIAELFTVLIRRRQRHRGAVYYGSVNSRGERSLTQMLPGVVYYGSVNAKGERSLTTRTGSPRNDKERGNE